MPNRHWSCSSRRRFANIRKRCTSSATCCIGAISTLRMNRLQISRRLRCTARRIGSRRAATSPIGWEARPLGSGVVSNTGAAVRGIMRWRRRITSRRRRTSRQLLTMGSTIIAATWRNVIAHCSAWASVPTRTRNGGRCPRVLSSMSMAFCASMATRWSRRGATEPVRASSLSWASTMWMRACAWTGVSRFCVARAWWSSTWRCAALWRIAAPCASRSMSWAQRSSRSWA